MEDLHSAEVLVACAESTVDSLCDLLVTIPFEQMCVNNRLSELNKLTKRAYLAISLSEPIDQGLKERLEKLLDGACHRIEVSNFDSQPDPELGRFRETLEARLRAVAAERHQH